MANSNERNPISISDQKKRSLQALERRIAVAKSELVQLQPKHCTSVVSEDQQKQKQQQIVNKSLFSPFHTPTLPCDILPSTKSFPMHSTVEGDDVNDTTYSQLSQPVHENLLRSGVKLSNGARVVNEILNDLLVKGDAAQKYMQGSKSMKIDGWLLLDTSVQGRGASTNARSRPLKSHSKRSKIRISMKQHRKYGNFNLPQKFINFDMYKPMHEMWKDYIIQILNLGERNRARCLLTADLHGAFLLVAESKITSFTGTRGIMIRETTETFGMVTNDNKFCGEDLCLVLQGIGSLHRFQIPLVPSRFYLRRALYSYSKLVGGRLHCMGMNSHQEALAKFYDLSLSLGIGCMVFMSTSSIANMVLVRGILAISSLLVSAPLLVISTIFCYFYLHMQGPQECLHNLVYNLYSWL